MAGPLNVVFFLVGLSSATLSLMSCMWWSFPKQPFRSRVEIILWGVPLGLFCVTNGVIAFVSIHISSFQISKYHTVSGVITQYIFSRMQWLLSGRGKRQMEGYWREPVKEQDGLLATKLKQDADTDYGKEHRFREINTMDEYRRRHPLTTYQYYKEYLEKITKGELKALTKEKLKRFGLTSGTTGQAKLIPMMPSRASIALTTGMALNSIVSENFRKFSPLQKWMTTYTAPRPLWTATGILVGPMNMYTEQQKKFIGIYNSPLAGFCILNDFASTYIHLLFSLRDQDVAVWITSFTTQVKKTLVLLEIHWRALLDDLATGTLNKDLAIPHDLRMDIESTFDPDPDRSDQLREEFETGFDGIVARIWPQMSHIVAVDVGDITENLQNYYAKGTPIYSAAYTTTEAEIGLNLWPDEAIPKFVLLPNSVIYEFIPEEHILEDQPKTCLLSELEKGKSYEIVITQGGGFCRYRLGDVVKVVQYHFNTPVIEFQYRTEQLLNLSNERMTEMDVKRALKEVMNQWENVALENWVCADSSLLLDDVKPPPDDEQNENYKKMQQTRDYIKRDSSELFYLLFIELSGRELIELTDKRKQEIDYALQKQCDKYRICRDSGKVAFPHIEVVPLGTFQKMEEYIVAHTAASHNQYKICRKLCSPYVLRFLTECNNLNNASIDV